MADDDKAAQGAKTSVVIVLIYLSRNITFFVLQGSVDIWSKMFNNT